MQEKNMRNIRKFLMSKKEENKMFKSNTKGLIVKLMNNNNKWEISSDNSKHKERKNKHLFKLPKERLSRSKWLIKIYKKKFYQAKIKYNPDWMI